MRLTARAALPVGKAHLLDARLLHHAGIVDQDVQPPGAGDHLADHLFRAVGIGEIRRDPLEFGVRPALRGKDARALLPQTPGNGLPDPAAPAGDEGNLGFEPLHATGFPPLTSTSEPHM